MAVTILLVSVIPVLVVGECLPFVVKEKHYFRGERGVPWWTRYKILVVWWVAVGRGVMFTAGGTRGLRRMTTVLNSNCRILDLHRVNYRTSVPRATSSFTNGTLRGTRCIGRRCNCSYFTSSDKLRMSILKKRPNICDTHCDNNNSRTGVRGLLRGLAKGDSHNTRFHAIVTLLVNRRAHLFRNVIHKAVVSRQHNRKKFNCSPVFIPRNCSLAFTRLNDRVGGHVDRHTGTIRRLTRCLGKWRFLTRLW